MQMSHPRRCVYFKRLAHLGLNTTTCNIWKREKKQQNRDAEQCCSSPSTPYLLSVTFIQLWMLPQLIFQHAWEYLFKYYQALWDREGAWNGPLIAHGYYFPLLFLNLRGNLLQMLREVEGNPQESFLSLKQQQRPKWGGKPINPQAKISPSGTDHLEKSVRKQSN